MKNAQRWIAAFDNHGDMCDRRAVELFFDFKRRWKPHTSIHGGDCFDFRALRRKASDEERRDGIGQDIADGCEFLRRMKPDVWLMGNHDARLTDVLGGDDRKLADLVSPIWDDVTEAAGAAVVKPYDKCKGRHWQGDLLLMHGMHHGLHAAAQAVNDFKANVLFGHIHAFSAASSPSVSGALYGYTSGSLCDNRMDYCRASPKTLRHESGFCYGVTIGKRTLVFQAKIINGVLYAGH